MALRTWSNIFRFSQQSPVDHCQCIRRVASLLFGCDFSQTFMCVALFAESPHVAAIRKPVSPSLSKPPFLSKYLVHTQTPLSTPLTFDAVCTTLSLCLFLADPAHTPKVPKCVCVCVYLYVSVPADVICDLHELLRRVVAARARIASSEQVGAHFVVFKSCRIAIQLVKPDCSLSISLSWRQNSQAGQRS